MKSATITEAKNGLSALIDRVRAGESIVITDRGIPVAVLEPATRLMEPEERLAKLERAGLLRRAKDPSAILKLLETPPIRLKGDASLLSAVLAEREESPW
jgi:prevent-host-death family protein